jgi:hypothetical protein
MKRSPEEWLAHRQGQALANVPPIEIAKIVDGPATAFESAAFRPLERLRVLDFTHIIAGPGSPREDHESGRQLRFLAYMLLPSRAPGRL